MPHARWYRQSNYPLSWHHRQVARPRARWLLSEAAMRSKRLLTVSASAEQTPEMRDTIKRLTKLFYFDQATGSGPRVVQQGQRPQPKPLQLGARIKSLPLWRVEWSVLPGSQEILHVMAPHYSHMFEGVFSRPRPWLFGHLYLPGGSKHLGATGYELSSGSRAPLVGTLAQVTRAVRLRDGKFLILATAVTRFKVCRCEKELPYSVADVELVDDVELLEEHNQPALAAVMQAAAPDTSITSLMAAGSAAAREACAAVSWAWLRGYELSVAAQQEWPGPGPREGESDLETHMMVQELMAHGVSEVLPLPDGVVIGRVNLGEVVAAANAAQQQALQAAVQLWQQDSAAESPMTSAAAAVLASGFDEAAVVSLNTTADRGIKFEGPEFSELVGSSSSSSVEDLLMLEAAVWAQLDTLVALATRVRGNRHTLPFGLLQLRPGAIDPHAVLLGIGARDKSVQPGMHNTHKAADGAGRAAGDGSSSSAGPADVGNAAAAARIVDEGAQQQEDHVQQQQHVSDMQERGVTGTSIELDGLQVPSSTHGNTSGSSGSSTEQHLLATSKYAFAASDGMDVHADPLWPPLRRAAKLSWAAAAVVGQMEQDKGESRQALLEAPSIAQRLRFVSAVLSKHVKVLSAIAAVKDVDK